MRAIEPLASARPRLAEISLGVVCPMANEESSAEKLVGEVLAAARGFAAVRFYAVLDRISRDRTRPLLDRMAASEARLEVVWAPENRSVVDAYLRGYRAALAAGHDYILEMDAGFSHQPSELPAFFDAIEQGYDCIFGSRFMPGGGIVDSPWHRRFVSRGGTIAANLLLGTRLHDMTSGFEAFSRDALAQILDRGIHSRAHFFQTEIKYHARHMRVVEVPIHYSAASPSVGAASLTDAFLNLFRLVRLRWKRP
ncbi:MAG TPA: glycosyltransferase [Bryobacteraceae bacterium]|nr:glycosyltransferase [Bryobacteraceae bacterium]